MNQTKDSLYECFERHLYSFILEEENHDEFVHKVVEDYVTDLITQGHIPIKYIETLRLDLEEEVLDMLRVKTYGYFNLEEFRRGLPESPAGNAKNKRPA